MNVLEHYIVEVHSVEPYTSDWTPRFPDREFLKVDLTQDCYGRVERGTHIFNTKEWEDIQEKGYYMA